MKWAGALFAIQVKLISDFRFWLDKLDMSECKNCLFRFYY